MLVKIEIYFTSDHIKQYFHEWRKHEWKYMIFYDHKWNKFYLSSTFNKVSVFRLKQPNTIKREKKNNATFILTSFVPSRVNLMLFLRHTWRYIHFNDHSWNKIRFYTEINKYPLFIEVCSGTWTLSRQRHNSLFFTVVKPQRLFNW